MERQKRFVGTRRTAELLGVSEKTVTRRVDDGSIPGAVRTPGGHCRIPVSWLLNELPPGDYDLNNQPRGFMRMTSKQHREVSAIGGSR